MAGTNGSDAEATVAVIGAGIMGAAMTRNLVAAGVNTRVWDRSAAATGPLGDAGAAPPAWPWPAKTRHVSPPPRTIAATG